MAAFRGWSIWSAHFGGMGSINDVALGHAEKDARLDALRSALCNRAASLKRARDRT